MSWFARPVRQINDIHPFTSIHRRSERRIIPEIRHSRVGLFLFGSVLLSAVIQEVMSKGIPITFTEEWKAQEKLYDEAQFASPIRRHKLGSDPVIPPSFLAEKN